MSRVFIENSSLQNIAAAIRLKNGSSDNYYPSEMANAIMELPIEVNDYLRFVAFENSTISITSKLSVTFEYSMDMITWNTWTYTESGGTRTFTTVSINEGNCIYVRGNNTVLGSSTTSSCTTFIMTGKIAAYGNIMYLLAADGSVTSITQPYCFRRLFSNCSSLIKSPDLPATTLSSNCYMNMFENCTALLQIPDLPATTLQTSCYQSMFTGCSNLTFVFSLPATTLATGCYVSMFAECSKLRYVPDLPATTLQISCYHSMFKNCISLLNAPAINAVTLTPLCYCYMFSGCENLAVAPDLPANTLVQDCYYYMFSGCTKLSSISVGATSWNTGYATNWVDGVASSGTFTKPANTTIPTGTSGIPSDWTVQSL